MQHVAFNPLAAIEEVAQGANLRVDLLEHAEGPFEGVAGAHLVGDRADAADPCREVGDFLEVASARGRLRRTGRFEMWN